MTVSSSTNRVNYNGDGSTTVFAYTFKVFDQDDLTVILRSSNGTETVQTITTNYTVSGVGDAGGGNVTMVTAPATGETLTILREQPLTQGLDLVPNDPFPANSIEEGLDKITFMVQKHEEELGRAIKASRTNTISGAEFTVSASDRANKVFAFDGSGDLAVTQELGTFRGDWAASTAYSTRDLVKDTSTNNIFIVNTAHTSSGAQPLTTNTNSAKYDLIVDAASATTSATAAATSATAAATSATASATSATAAATSESNAATSATNASTSETNAASSATNASTSESNAAASETAAATSESNAATSATNASTSATNASTSASNAATSESNAAASQSAAATSATAAATSATSAATNATNAATSATSASTAQTAAETAQTAAEAAQAAAELAADNFDDTYLGSKASDPTVDNDGGALNAGDLYFNTTSNVLKVYSGSAWQEAALDASGYVTTSSDATITGTLTLDGLVVDTDTLTVDTTNNRLGVNNASPATALDVTGTVTADGLTVSEGSSGATANTNADAVVIENSNKTGLSILTPNTSEGLIFFGDPEDDNIGRIAYNHSTNAMTLVTNNNTRFNIGSGGDISFYEDTGTTAKFFWDASAESLGIGTSSPSSTLEVKGANGSDTTLTVTGGTTAGLGSNAKIKLVPDGTAGVGIINAEGSDGSDVLALQTNGSEAMRIDSSGNLLVGKTSNNFSLTGGRISGSGVMTLTADGNELANLNRLTNDGTLIFFTQANTTEGSISVSGTTVSYNGGHLSRWSQLTDGSEDTSIVKGTVMTNLDQMAVWHHEAVAATYYEEGDELPIVTEATYYGEGDTIPEGSEIGDVKTEAVYAQVGDEKTPAKDAYTEDNEQLNCMAVSSVEGDPNVAGVFVNWDHDDDDFNDMNVAMTGDMVIRIAQGTTVARGDLLMSAGDGTAKPQDDDIVRSKTIAKVTSTNVSHTYDDGSYLVPCVLMAC